MPILTPTIAERRQKDGNIHIMTTLTLQVTCQEIMRTVATSQASPLPTSTACC